MRQLRKCSNVIIAAFLDHEKVQKTDLKPLQPAACKKWMKSSITIAASAVCKHKITDRLNKIQLHTVGCPIFYFCSKQTMDVFSYCTFTWICVDFPCKTAFISYRVMSAKTRVLKCCCLLFAWTEFWESTALCCADGKMQICYPTCSHTLPRTKGAATHMPQICK